MAGGHGENSTSAQIATETTDGVTTSYTYDAVGNIKTVRKNGVLQESYDYDNLNQLTKVTYANGDVYEYSYTTNGNLTEVKKNGTVTHAYTYGNESWKDQLTAINGDSISYDEVGNPTFYYGNNQYFEWENGRRPTTVYNTGGTVTFGYASDGSRTSKTIHGVTTTYYYAGGVLYGEQTGYNKLVYLYDENGTPYGFVYNDSPYYYDKNLQGDVTGIWNKNGVKIANYTYDAWGNVLSITNQYGEDVTSQPRHQGNLNPIRYRGYYYDIELNLYWLNTRFYDPNLGRFVNADGQINTSLGVLGTNLFAYCLNNAVNQVDAGGNKPGDWFKTPDEAAEDFARTYNKESINKKREYGSAIYKFSVTTVTPRKTKKIIDLWFFTFSIPWTTYITKTEVYYSYTEPNIGQSESTVVPNFFTLNTVVATVHTHANYDPKYDNENFSAGWFSDIGWSDFFGMNSYVVTPGGYLKKYTYRTRAITVLADDIPWDPNSPLRK